MIIYKTINNINNKYYIGQHNTSADDGYLGSGKILGHAINKHGKGNFKRVILENGIDDQQTLNECEIFWISSLSATDKT